MLILKDEFSDSDNDVHRDNQIVLKHMWSWVGSLEKLTSLAQGRDQQQTSGFDPSAMIDAANG